MRSYEDLLVYFERAALSYYRVSPDLYCLEEDDWGGKVGPAEWRGDNLEANEDSQVRVRFGFRRLLSGRVCVAAFGPDVKKLPERHRFIWWGHLIQSPAFAREDPAFERFVSTYLEGEFLEPGPKHEVQRAIQLVRALTRQILYFTDGSSMAITVGSNAWDLANQFDGMEPQDVHTDLLVSWVPSGQKRVEASQ